MKYNAIWSIHLTSLSRVVERDIMPVKPMEKSQGNPAGGGDGHRNGPHAEDPNGVAPEIKSLRREDLLSTLGSNVRNHRKDRGMSQQALARAAGLSQRYVAQLEAGSGNISVGRLDDVAGVLGVRLAQLLRRPDSSSAALGGGEAASLRREILLHLGILPVPDLRNLLKRVRRVRPAKISSQPSIMALVGLRGSGKSTLGPLLAGSLNQSFVELDDLIQESTGLALTEIFELHGEQYYRLAERKALQGLISSGVGTVVAVSGGSVTDPELFRLLRERTLLIWLKTQPRLHMSRVLSQGDRRPMANRPDAQVELQALLTARTPYYEQARIIVDTSEPTPAACVKKLLSALRELQ